MSLFLPPLCDLGIVPGQLVLAFAGIDLRLNHDQAGLPARGFSPPPLYPDIRAPCVLLRGNAVEPLSAHMLGVESPPLARGVYLLQQQFHERVPKPVLLRRV